MRTRHGDTRFSLAPPHADRSDADQRSAASDGGRRRHDAAHRPGTVGGQLMPPSVTSTDGSHPLNDEAVFRPLEDSLAVYADGSSNVRGGGSARGEEDGRGSGEEREGRRPHHHHNNNNNNNPREVDMTGETDIHVQSSRSSSGTTATREGADHAAARAYYANSVSVARHTPSATAAETPSARRARRAPRRGHGQRPTPTTTTAATHTTAGLNGSLPSSPGADPLGLLNMPAHLFDVYGSPSPTPAGGVIPRREGSPWRGAASGVGPSPRRRSPAEASLGTGGASTHRLPSPPAVGLANPTTDSPFRFPASPPPQRATPPRAPMDALAVHTASAFASFVRAQQLARAQGLTWATRQASGGGVRSPRGVGQRGRAVSATWSVAYSSSSTSSSSSNSSGSSGQFSAQGRVGPAGAEGHPLDRRTHGQRSPHPAASAHHHHHHHSPPDIAAAAAAPQSGRGRALPYPAPPHTHEDGARVIPLSVREAREAYGHSPHRGRRSGRRHHRAHAESARAIRVDKHESGHDTWEEAHEAEKGGGGVRQHPRRGRDADPRAASPPAVGHGHGEEEGGKGGGAPTRRSGRAVGGASSEEWGNEAAHSAFTSDASARSGSTQGAPRQRGGPCVSVEAHAHPQAHNSPTSRASTRKDKNHARRQERRHRTSRGEPYTGPGVADAAALSALSPFPPTPRRSSTTHTTALVGEREPLSRGRIERTTLHLTPPTSSPRRGAPGSPATPPLTRRGAEEAMALVLRRHHHHHHNNNNNDGDHARGGAPSPFPTPPPYREDPRDTVRERSPASPSRSPALAEARRELLLLRASLIVALSHVSSPTTPALPSPAARAHAPALLQRLRELVAVAMASLDEGLASPRLHPLSLPIHSLTLVHPTATARDREPVQSTAESLPTCLPIPRNLPVAAAAPMTGYVAVHRAALFRDGQQRGKALGPARWLTRSRSENEGKWKDNGGGAWATCFAVADDHGLVLYAGTEDYSGGHYERVLGAVRYVDFALFIPDFRIDPSGPVLPPAEPNPPLATPAPSPALALSAGYRHHLQHTVTHYKLTEPGCFYFGFLPRGVGEGRRGREGDGRGPQGTDDTGESPTHSRGTSWVPVKGAAPPLLLRVSSTEAHRAWVHFLTSRFNRHLYQSMFPFAPFTSCAGGCVPDVFGVGAKACQTESEPAPAPSTGSRVGEQHQGVSAEVPSKHPRPVMASVQTQAGNPVVRAEHIFTTSEGRARRRPTSDHPDRGDEVTTPARARAEPQGARAALLQTDALTTALRDSEELRRIAREERQALADRVAELTAACTAQESELESLRAIAGGSFSTGGVAAGAAGARTRAVAEVEAKLRVAHEREKATWEAERRALEDRARVLAAEVRDLRQGRHEAIRALAAKAAGDLEAFHEGVVGSVEAYVQELQGRGGAGPQLPAKDSTHHDHHHGDRRGDDGRGERGEALAAPTTPVACRPGTGKGVALLLVTYDADLQLLDACLTVDESEAKLLSSGPTAQYTGRQWELRHYESDAELRIQLKMSQVRPLPPWERAAGAVGLDGSRARSPARRGVHRVDPAHPLLGVSTGGAGGEVPLAAVATTVSPVPATLRSRAGGGGGGKDPPRAPVNRTGSAGGAPAKPQRERWRY